MLYPGQEQLRLNPNDIETIRAGIGSDDITYVLPFETALLHGTLNTLGHEQRAIGAVLGEAMNQSSETWHDNAPADAAVNASKVVVERANLVMDGLRRAAIVEYPDPASRRVTLGSVMGLVFPGDTEPEDHLLVGFCRELPSISETAPFSRDLTLVTVNTPLGRVLLGQELGDVVSYTGPTGRKFDVKIETLHQIQPTDLDI